MDKSILALLGLFACSFSLLLDAQASFVGEVEKDGYIPMVVASEATTVSGMLIGGAPSSPSLIAESTICFTEEMKLRKVTAFKSGQRFLYTVPQEELPVVLALLKNGSASIGAGIDFYKVKSLKLELIGVSSESIEVARLQGLYREIAETCKQHLGVVGLIMQTLQVEGLKLTLYDENDNTISLSSSDLIRYFQIPSGVRYAIEGQTQVIFHTPKTVAVKLGRIKGDDDDQQLLYIAARVVLGKYIFKKIASIPTKTAASDATGDSESLLSGPELRDLERHDLVDLYSEFE
ncbi:MAG: hypothetical protein HQK52_05620 [Oligoflexia bacterium]|nr:hypothetical protein [Oligoflexia bacterium]